MKIILLRMEESVQSVVCFFAQFFCACGLIYVSTATHSVLVLITACVVLFTSAVHAEIASRLCNTLEDTKKRLERANSLARPASWSYELIRIDTSCESLAWDDIGKKNDRVVTFVHLDSDSDSDVDDDTIRTIDINDAFSDIKSYLDDHDHGGSIIVSFKGPCSSTIRPKLSVLTRDKWDILESNYAITTKGARACRKYYGVRGAIDAGAIVAYELSWPETVSEEEEDGDSSD